MADQSEAQMRPIVTRREAWRSDLLRFFTGKPCGRGHISERLTSSGTCVECSGERRRTPEGKAKKNQRERNRKKLMAVDVLAAFNEKRRQDYAANKDREQARRLRYRASKLKAAKAWRENNPDKQREYARRRRALKANAPGDHTGNDIQSLLGLQNYRCAYCARSVRNKYEVDHIHPLSLGGSNDRRNLQILCASCNRSKNAKHPIDYAQETGRLL